jgi:hypothetical protein
MVGSASSVRQRFFHKGWQMKIEKCSRKLLARDDGGSPEEPKLPLPHWGRGEKARELHKLIKDGDLAAYITRQISKNLAGHYWGSAHPPPNIFRQNRK